MPLSFRVRKGQRIRASHHNALVDIAEQATLQHGTLKGHQDSDGFTPRVTVQATLSVSTAFRIGLGEDGDDVLLTFSPSHVAGEIPTIGDEGLDEFDEAGNPPVLRVDKGAWVKRGAGERALVMFRYDLDHADFSVSKVTPVAVASVPLRKPWTWHKLVAFLVRQNGAVRVFPQMYFPQGFLAADTNSAGGFRPLPFAEL